MSVAATGAPSAARTWAPSRPMVPPAPMTTMFLLLKLFMLSTSVVLVVVLAGFVVRGQLEVPPGDAPGLQPGRLCAGHRVIEPIGAAAGRLQREPATGMISVRPGGVVHAHAQIGNRR